MLNLLLDEHISPQVAEGLRRRSREIKVWGLVEWENGRLLGLPDTLLLQTATDQDLTLVTYDRKTIPPLLKTWAEEGRDHGGVVFVDEKTIPASDFGGLIRALRSLWSEARHWEWTNRICILRR
jgi:hypothetical protein